MLSPTVVDRRAGASADCWLLISNTYLERNTREVLEKVDTD